MKTDMQLLELAAKAAGIRHIEYTNGYDGEYGLMTCDEHGRHQGMWSSLEDDGDALRLAVALKMDVSAFRDHATAYYETGWCDELNGCDPLAATRRAITRSAAAIGEGMK
jgi:hypothetical protein